LTNPRLSPDWPVVVSTGVMVACCASALAGLALAAYSLDVRWLWMVPPVALPIFASFLT
jgi:hypothetical protein